MTQFSTLLRRTRRLLPLLGLAASLWWPEHFAGRLSDLNLPPPDYRYGLAAQLALALRLSGLGVALVLMATLAVSTSDSRFHALNPPFRMRVAASLNLTGCLVRRGAFGLLLAGLLGLWSERAGALLVPSWPGFAAAACLLAGTSWFAQQTVAAARTGCPVAARGPIDLRALLYDAAPALALYWIARPESLPPHLLALGPFAPWFLPWPWQGLAPWAAGAGTLVWASCLLPAGGPLALDHRPETSPG